MENIFIIYSDTVDQICYISIPHNVKTLPFIVSLSNFLNTTKKTIRLKYYLLYSNYFKPLFMIKMTFKITIKKLT
jgi:hypothetical protein